MEASQMLNIILNHTGLKIGAFAREVKQVAQTFYDIKSGKVKSFTPDVSQKIITRFPEISYVWLTTGKGSMLNDWTSDLKNEPKQLINPTVKETLAQLDKVQNGKKKSYPIETEGIEVDDDLLIKNKATVIPIAGQAGLESAMYDPILFSELKTEVYEHPKKLSGEYFKIEVKGNSMYDGTDEGLKEGDWAYCRSLERRHWQERLHTHNWKNWCFFHGERGIIFKCIESYNIETGEIHLYSRNPDKKEYPNFTIKISECTYICNVVEKRQSFNP